MAAANGLAVTGGLFLLAACAPPLAEVRCTSADSPGAIFDDVTATAGLSREHLGDDWGVAWGDLDGDGDPDLYVTNHTRSPSLYVNNGDGSFDEQAAARLGDDLEGVDTHGGAWADFDGDGDRDLLVTVGATRGEGVGPNQLWINRGDGFFTDEAAARGVDLPEGRGRLPVWVDVNQDGWLDVVLTNRARSDGLAPTALLISDGHDFAPADDDLGFDLKPDAALAQLAAPWGRPALIAALSDAEYPQIPQALVGGRLVGDTELRDQLAITYVTEALYGDLGCDGLEDVVLLRGFGDDEPEVYQASSTEVRAVLAVGNLSMPPHVGLDVRGGGALTVTLQAIPDVTPDEIYLGAAGAAPPLSARLALDPADPALAGLPDYAPGEDAGLFIGYDAAEDTWSLRLSGDDWRIIGLGVAAEVAFEAVEAFQVAPTERVGKIRLTDDLDGAPRSIGFDPPPSCAWGALADFDNDMDLDLYLSCAHPTHDVPDALWLGRGDGSFERAEDIGDAGLAGPGRSSTPAVADYDGDGALDLFVSLARVNDVGFNEGPHRLLRNRGNQNHWLALDLVGGGGNRDAIGATVWLTAGGVTQVRRQLGGLHGDVQDHTRLHFGLGANDTIEALLVRWTDGRLQSLDPPAVDQVLELAEPW